MARHQRGRKLINHAASLLGKRGVQGNSGKVKVITDRQCAGYRQSGHPERPERILRAIEKLSAQKDVTIEWVLPQPGEDEAILRAHTSVHLGRLAQSEDFDADTPAHPGIADFARASAGAALEGLKCAQRGEPSFSLMRPPGHHATREQAMGFCYLNNVAIATLEALASGCQRVAVFDFDVHHGNGTESILLDHPGAAFFSIHQFPCYPGTGGENAGSNCFNFPVPPATTALEYRNVLSRAVEKMQKFKPELIAVSAGFDAYARDPLAQEKLEAADFHWLGETLRGLRIPMFSLLEGGYSSDLPELILAYLRGIEGQKLA